jgi:hypothetical protein
VNKLLGASGSAFNSTYSTASKRVATDPPAGRNYHDVWGPPGDLGETGRHMVGDAARNRPQRYLAIRRGDDPVRCPGGWPEILGQSLQDGRLPLRHGAAEHDLVDWTVRRAKDKSLPLGRVGRILAGSWSATVTCTPAARLDKLSLIAAEAKNWMRQLRGRHPGTAGDPAGRAGQAARPRRASARPGGVRFLSEGRSVSAPLLIWRVKQVAQVAALRADSQPGRQCRVAGITPFAAHQSRDGARVGRCHGRGRWPATAAKRR